MLAWLAAALLTVLWRAPLGHDEAQYALAASDLLADRPLRWNYLSQGMLALSVPGVAAGGSELALRIAPLLAGVLFVLVAANLARRVTTETTAAWLVAILAASIATARRSAELLSDVPAATGLLIGTALLVTEITRDDGPRWRIVLAAPALAAAFYLRYGSVVPIAIIGLVMLAGGLRGIARRPLPVVATLGVFALLLVPHLVISNAITGRPLGILLQSSSVPGAAYRGVGLVTYLTSNPFTWYGIVATPLLLLGIVSIARLRDRRLVMLWVIAIANVIGIGFTAIAQPRYIFLSLVILLMLGTELARTILAGRRPLAIAAAATVGVSWLVTLAMMVATYHARPLGIERTLTAAAAIRADAAGARCKVIGRHTTQLEWYSGCTATLSASPDELATVRMYVVSEKGTVPFSEQPGHHVPVVTYPDGLAVIRLDP